MKINAKLAILGILVATTFMDAIVATLVRFKFPFFNESNPIYIYTKSLSVFFAIKFGMVFLLFLLFYSKKWYCFFKSDFVRYSWSIILVIGILGQFNGFVSGVDELKKPVGEVIEIPDEVKLEYYKETNYTPDLNKENPLFNFAYLYFFMLSTFLVFRVMERHNWEEENV